MWGNRERKWDLNSSAVLDRPGIFLNSAPLCGFIHTGHTYNSVSSYVKAHDRGLCETWCVRAEWPVVDRSEYCRKSKNERALLIRHLQLRLLFVIKPQPEVPQARPTQISTSLPHMTGKRRILLGSKSSRPGE